MITTLDCSSYESALETAAAGLGLQPGTLRDELIAFDPSALPERLRRQYPCRDLLALHVGGATPHELPVLEAITWFHATRVPHGVDFSDGILPLKLVEERIHSFMNDLFMRVKSEPRYKNVELHRSEHGGRNNANRMMTPGGDQGPFAHLVRAAIFQSKTLGDHDYLVFPESMENCYLAWRGDFGESLRAAFLEVTEPCIVVFQMPGAKRPDVLGAALMYLHYMSRGMEFIPACNTCFDGEGEPVPPNAIIRIERGADLAP